MRAPRHGGARPLLRRAVLAAVAAGLACALALPAAGELRRVEAVGVVPIRPEDARSGVPRDAAVRAAVQAAALRVARNLLPQDFVPPDPGPPPAGEPQAPLPDPDTWIENHLGDDPFAYAVRFSVLEDRGPRPVLYGSDPEAEEEYVVVAEVQVDVEAVRERLEEVGALAETRGRGVARELLLVIEGLRGYRPLALLRETLRSDPGVGAVVPIEFTRERVLLEVSADVSAETLVADLRRRAPEGLQIVPVETGPDTVTLLVDWSPPPAAPDGAAPDSVGD